MIDSDSDLDRLGADTTTVRKRERGTDTDPDQDAWRPTRVNNWARSAYALHTLSYQSRLRITILCILYIILLNFATNPKVPAIIKEVPVHNSVGNRSLSFCGLPMAKQNAKNAPMGSIDVPIEPNATRIDINALTKISEIEDLIAELCVGAPNDDVKFCLRSYQPARSTHQIERDINRSKKDVLVATCKFLQIPHCEQKNKNQLSRLILCRIQNLLPDDCGLCKNRYQIKMRECPLLACSICGQGVHEECWLKLLTDTSPADVSSDKTTLVNKFVNPLNLPGIFYICPACQETTIPQEDEKKKG